MIFMVCDYDLEFGVDDDGEGGGDDNRDGAEQILTNVEQSACKQPPGLSRAWLYSNGFLITSLLLMIVLVLENQPDDPELVFVADDNAKLMMTTIKIMKM